MKNRMFWLGTIFVAICAGGYIGPAVALWFGVIGGILLVLS